MPAPERPAALPGRRVVLRAGLAGAAAATVLGTAACRLRMGSPGTSTPTTAPQRTADELALDRAAARADQLATLYAEGALARADLAPALRRLAADHTAHTQALLAVGASVPTATPSETPSETPSATPSETPSATASSTAPTAPPVTATTAVSVLGLAERSAVEATLADLAPIGPDAARLLASIAACGSAHLTLLARLPARAGSTGQTGTPTGAPS